MGLSATRGPYIVNGYIRASNIAEQLFMTRNAAISACEKGGQCKQALESCESMLCEVVQQNTVTYSAATNACEKGLRPYNGIIAARGPYIANGYIRASKTVELVFEMQGNIIFRNAAISACEKGGQCKQALGFSESMLCERVRRVQRITVTYCAVVSACDKGRQCQQALHFFEEKPNEGAQRTNLTFNAIISACERGRQGQQALEFFENLLERVQQNIIIHHATVSACEKGRQWQLALKLFKKVFEKRVLGKLSLILLLPSVLGRKVGNASRLWISM